MRKAGLITLAIVASTMFTSCSSSEAAQGGYFGVSNTKGNKERQKEFKKPKHRIKKNRSRKKRSLFQ